MYGSYSSLDFQVTNEVSQHSPFLEFRHFEGLGDWCFFILDFDADDAIYCLYKSMRSTVNHSQFYSWTGHLKRLVEGLPLLHLWFLCKIVVQVRQLSVRHIQANVVSIPFSCFLWSIASMSNDTNCSFGANFTFFSFLTRSTLFVRGFLASSPPVA